MAVLPPALLLESYSYMHSEKSSLVFTVMLSWSSACLRCYGCWNVCVFRWIHWDIYDLNGWGIYDVNGRSI